MRITQTPTRNISPEAEARYAKAKAHLEKCEAEYEAARKAIPYNRVTSDLAWNSLRHAESDLIAAS